MPGEEVTLGQRVRARSELAGADQLAARLPCEMYERDSPLAEGGQAAQPALLLRHAPVRADRAGNIRERAFNEFGNQKAAVVDRARHGHQTLRNRLETDTAVIS